jgi:hypothetical protein
MQKCKYLDDLGLKIHEYGTNFISDEDARNIKWKQEQKEYGFDNRETWNLNISFIEWIYTRLKMYKEVCNIDLKFYKFNYKEEELTQGEIIDKILELCAKILTSERNVEDEKMIDEKTREICDLWKEILPYMWW